LLPHFFLALFFALAKDFNFVLRHISWLASAVKPFGLARTSAGASGNSCHQLPMSCPRTRPRHPFLRCRRICTEFKQDFREEFGASFSGIPVAIAKRQ